MADVRRHWRSYLLVVITAAALVVAVLAIRQSDAHPRVAPASVAGGQATPAPPLDPDAQRRLTAAATQLVGGSRPRAKAKKRRATRAARARSGRFKSRQGLFSEADIRRAGGHVTAIALFCQRLAQERTPSDAEILASLTGELELSLMVRKDPDTSYLWPSLNGDLTVRETMRQVVGQARDTFASHDCDPGSARHLTMVLETLPR